MTWSPSRRELLEVGLLGSGLTLAQFLRLQAAACGAADSGRSAIFVFLQGGPSHQDMFDMKPDAPPEYRGQFRPIDTNVPGLEICQHLPRLARRADKYAVIRGVSHNLAAHGLGTRYLMTGNRPLPVLRYPVYGSVVSKQLPCRVDMPPFVAIDRPLEGPGFLGSQFGPLGTGEKPQYGRPFNVRGITLGEGLTISRFASRHQLRQAVDTAFRGYEGLDDPVQGLDQFAEQARQIIGSPRARQAFDLSLEDRQTVERFGKHEFGQSMLLAFRLVEAGVRFVTVLVEGWDTHQDNFGELQGKLLPPLDQSLSGLLDTLDQRGLLESTAILVTGEFGRTPKVNARAGRDHWARAMFALMAGGDVRGGTVVGATNGKAEEPAGDGFTPDDLAASFYRNIGLDPRTEFEANMGRPITLVRNGKVIQPLFS